MAYKDLFQQMALYNQWMNAKLYEASSQLSLADLSADKGAFFGSVLGSLNHILVGDSVWLRRFSALGHASPTLSYVLTLDMPKATTDILFPDFAELSDVRKRVDAAIIAYVDDVPDAVYTKAISYKNMEGKPFNKAFGFVMQHFFNHQTHHRGQITTLLSQMGVDVGVTDLPAILPDA